MNIYINLNINIYIYIYNYIYIYIVKNMKINLNLNININITKNLTLNPKLHRFINRLNQGNSAVRCIRYKRVKLLQTLVHALGDNYIRLNTCGADSERS